MAIDVHAVTDALQSALDPTSTGELRGAAAIRLRLRLQPAGGSGTKVMPPTYLVDKKPVYIRESRMIDGESIECVSLDSVASQANRLESALADAIDAGTVHVPTIWVDQAEFGHNSALVFPHRAFDAWVEDAELDGAPFGKTPLWKALASSSRHDLWTLMRHCPTCIVLGSWASREASPQTTTRLARALTSEIVGVGVVDGKRAKSRIDVHNVSSAITVFKGQEARISTTPEHAHGGPDKPEKFKGKDDGKPAAAGYGNVTPSLAEHGGVTLRHALQIATISLAALRECRFPTPDGADRERDLAGRVMLAALGMRMLALQVDHGYDLRSGCLLIPEEEPTFELLDRLGRTHASWPVMGVPTEALLGEAIARGAALGIDWAEGDVHLRASEAQLYLLRESLGKPEEEA